MAFKLNRWKDLLNGREFRDDTNANWQQIEEIVAQLMKADEATRTRLNNLILKSGGTSPNEVVDSRVDTDNKVHGSLQDRLTADFNKIKTQYSGIDSQMVAFATLAAELQSDLQGLYDAKSGSVEIYVDGNKGSDAIGTGAYDQPFKTINKAVSSVPLLMTNNLTIICAPAKYDEDVYISQLLAPSIAIQPSNLESITPHTKDTGFYVRSITAKNISGYFYVGGLTQMNTANSGARYTPGGLNQPCTLYFDRVSYHAVNKCRFAENVKALENYAIYSSASNGRIYDCNFQNQYECYFTNFTSNTAFDRSNTGSNNFRAISAGRSLVYATALQVAATEPIRTYEGGQVFQ